ncbi:Holliday junction branch migration protein RuvA [Nitrosomonas sp.]|uniref:Holliday junction branch migration protein RuvA n=1 Tax=Nitrosomonas sp. TaxID=42353 RepID=UPI001D38FB22|nr:Holliday junction branch migration protein RuvA [Nitrosomonas sp.]MBX3617212.1 Holliday junction branch migration protein RuvA [Nitrosomonas sp.]
MIGRLTGVLIEKHPPHVLLDVRGIGYEIDVPMSTYYDLPVNGTEVTLYTHLLIREDIHLLFGFATEPERQVFRQLIKVSGIGARTALALLSGLSVQDLYQAIGTQDSARLIKIPGIGKKTAERLLLELRDKLSSKVIDAEAISSSSRNGSDMLNALLSLGYNDREANWAIDQIQPEASLTDGIRRALQLLSKER